MSTDMKLIYWPGLPGRGEYIRLALEYSKTPYTDVLDAKEVMAYNAGKADIPSTAIYPFAPPVFVDGDLVLSQTPNILLYLGKKLNLAGETEQDQYSVNGLALTALDLCNEAHDSHHPIAVGEYYEKQKEEAMRRAKDFRENRIPKFLGYFERTISDNKNNSGTLIGKDITYADLVLFQVVDGLFFAFPKCMKKMSDSGKIDKIIALKKRIETETPIKEYLASDRRQPYSNGIFRHYPELDDEK